MLLLGIPRTSVPAVLVCKVEGKIITEEELMEKFPDLSSDVSSQVHKLTIFECYSRPFSQDVLHLCGSPLSLFFMSEGPVVAGL